MVFNDHRDAQILFTVGSNLTGNGVGTAAQAPGHDDGHLLLGEGIRGLLRGLVGGFLLGLAVGLGRISGLAAAGCQAQDHDEREGQRHELFHRFFSSFLKF